MLSHFCFDGSSITAFNGTQAVVTLYESELNCGIPGELLYKLATSYTTEEIDIVQKEKEVHLKAGSNNAKMATIPTEDLVFDMPDIEGLPSFDLTPEFLSGLDECLMSVSDNPMQKNLYGLTVKNNKKGLYIYSTDIKTLSWFKTNGIPKTDFEILFPKLFTGLLIVFGRAYKEGTFYFGEDFVVVDFGDTMLYSKIMTEIDFLAFDTEINRHLKKDTTFQEIPDPMLGALARSIIFVSSEIDQFANIKIKGKKMEIYATGPYGNNLEQVVLKEALPELEFKMDVGLLQRGITVSKELAFIKSESDYVFIGKGKVDGFTHMILSPEEEK